MKTTRTKYGWDLHNDRGRYVGYLNEYGPGEFVAGVDLGKGLGASAVFTSYGAAYDWIEKKARQQW